jgi:hypothetical protein
VELAPVDITLGTPISKYPRSEGIHLSRILRARAVEKGILPATVAGDLSLTELGGNDEWWAGLDTASQLRIAIGLAWEEWYIPHLGDVTDHPGEMQVDGIFMTHDGESLDVIITPDDSIDNLPISEQAKLYLDGCGKKPGPRTVLALHEVKATYKSTKTVGDLRDQWLWLEQVKGYCKGLGTTIAYVHVLFVCGDYKYPITPQLKCWRIEFTQAEIDKTWEEMTGYVRLHRTIVQEM